MKIFLSHSGKDKSFVREVVQGLPKFLKTHEILWGEKLSKSLRKAIKTESDFVIVFIDRDALESSWVQKEITWALEQEAQLKREFLLPILVDNIDEKPEWLNEKVYLVLQDQEEYSVKVLCEKIVLNLFNLLANSWEKSKAKTSLGRGDVAMSSMIECDLVEFIADRTQGPYSNPRWLDEFQEQHPDGKIEIFVIARTAKWWYELISQQKVKHLSKFDIHILASDPTVDRRLLAPDDRREFSTDIAFFPNKFAYLERKLENLSYAHAPALVLDSFTFVRSGNDKIV
ncbi:MAG: toll/interleukin-1 receptor domain-containing protein, partial [Candidatus Omnitrophica bacterium]|nr:toll/interleukin-1 receptor domain-containing protein [Candidatus Omnitrophota bacterium]